MISKKGFCTAEGGFPQAAAGAEALIVTAISRHPVGRLGPGVSTARRRQVLRGAAAGEGGN